MTQVALVTGASRNIGRAIALSMAADGFEVACFGRDNAALEETAVLICDAGGVASVHVGGRLGRYIGSVYRGCSGAARQY